MVLNLGSPQILAFHSLLLLSAILAIWKGGPPERWGAAIILLMDAIQLIGIQFAARSYLHVDYASVGVDLVGLLGFGVIALNAKRFWPIWASSLQLLSTSAHFARLLEVNVEPMVYAVMKSLPTFLVCLVLMAGTALHRRRVRMRGFDPSWQAWHGPGSASASPARSTSRP